MSRLFTRRTCQQLRLLTSRNLIQKNLAQISPRASTRFFHATLTSFSKTSTPSFQITSLTTDRYHRLADELLDHMVEKLEELADSTNMKGFDVEYNQGVMTISVGSHGTYVINKQPPNHQIWLSSPVSGPQRYDYDEKHQTWFYPRDSHTLTQVLNDELSAAFGHKIDLLTDYDPQEQ
ncbi:hypothetical protein BY458DRAFT_483765 [Sporodiniella umbellata]|nr:hypothetical protein BY458DRAFT_483765 [Sporodiniella umbellata]